MIGLAAVNGAPGRSRRRRFTADWLLLILLGINTAVAQTPSGQAVPRPELVVQTGYSNFFGPARFVFSPDSRLLATTAFGESNVKLWEAATGRELRTLTGRTAAIANRMPSIAFSPDSRLIATSGDNTIKVWDVATGREVQTFAGPVETLMAPADVVFMSFTPDGRALIAISDAIRVCDLTSGTERRVGNLSALRFNSSDAAPGPLFGFNSGYALSPDGSQLGVVALESRSKVTVKFLDTASGGELRKVNLSGAEKPSVDHTSLVLTDEGGFFAAGVDENKLKVWNASGEVQTFARVTDGMAVAGLSSRGDLVAAAVADHRIKIWNSRTGRDVLKLDVPQTDSFKEGAILAFGFSGDGKLLAVGGTGAQPAIWDVATGKQLHGLEGHSNLTHNAAFNTDGKLLRSGARTLWDLGTGQALRVVAGEDRLYGLPTPDGKLLAAIAPNNSAIRLVETSSGRTLHTFAPGGGGMISQFALSADARLLAAAVFENQIKIWDVETGREMHTLINPDPVSQLGFSNDGGKLIVVGRANRVTVWNAAAGSRSLSLGLSVVRRITGANANPTGQEKTAAAVKNLQAMVDDRLAAMAAARTGGRTVTSAALSPDGRLLAVGGTFWQTDFNLAPVMSIATSGTIKLEDLRKEVERVLGNAKVVTTGQIMLFDAATGHDAGVLRSHGRVVEQVAFNTDGRLLASAATDNTIQIWDVVSRSQLRTLTGHTATVNSMAFSPDGRLFASTSDDGCTLLWDLETGVHLATLVSLFDGGDWLVVTPDGLFDGSPAAWNQILWRYNRNTFDVAPIEWFFNEFYYPGLLSDIFAGKRPRATEDISQKDRRQPGVKLTLAEVPPGRAVTTRKVKIKIELEDAQPDPEHPQGSGARDLRLFRNGSLVQAWRGDVLNGQTYAALEADVPIIAGENRFVAYAFNRDNVKSRDASLVIQGADRLRRPGTLYVLTIGINEYANPQFNLRYAVADAREFGTEMLRQQERLARFGHTEIVELLDGDATKANILQALSRLAGVAQVPSPKARPTPALERLKPVEPEDAVVIYFSGHGAAGGPRFYLIPHDLTDDGRRDTLDASNFQAILSHSISDQELERAVEGLDAGQTLLVIDACNSGQALESDEPRRGPMNSKGLAQLAYEKGMYILTAAQSFQAALETSQLGHGYLTYALVEEGLKRAAADFEPRDGRILIREWLDYATLRVPQLQVQQMKESRGLRVNIAFAEGDERVFDNGVRDVQRPRVFYRRELESNPLVVARGQ